MKRSSFFRIAITAMVVTASTSAYSAEKYVQKEVSDVVGQLGQSRLGDRMFRALEQLLASASIRLEKEGHRALASEIASDWNQQLAIQYSQFGALDLGDHEPLNQWLARTYDKIERRLGRRIMNWLRYDDIKVFNYAIPVVFRPNGTVKDSWDQTEYGRHFVPFAGAITYWSVSGVCQVMAPGLWVYACGTVSEVPRYAMEKWIAPAISRQVYLRATGGTCEAASFEGLELGELLDRAELELGVSSAAE